ncbi:MAG: hypothetical protein IKW33_01600 [Clostridia bacterium]|nr:hypothetical protein [Clostridia bacterium]
MIKKTLNVVKNKSKKVSLLDLLKFKHYTTGCIENNGKIYSYGFLEDKQNVKLPNNFIDFLVIDGEIIFYANDGKLYKQTANDFELYTLEKFSKKTNRFRILRTRRKNGYVGRKRLCSI